jgi:hypothetical protein
MINPHNVFVADARPSLAVPVQRSAYVFGAAHPLGEALLAQILASSDYSRVYVSTTAALPATVAHLQGMIEPASGAPFMLQDDATAIDFIFVASDEAYSAQSNAPRYGFAARSNVYAPLIATDVPALLSRVSIASNAVLGMQQRWFVVAPGTAAAPLGSAWATAYSTHMPCLVYGLASGDRSAASKTAYQFKPEGNTMLDRLGVWVLNVLSNTAHGMMNPQKTAPLTAVKTAQRLAARFATLSPVAGLTVLTPSDLT